MDGSINLINYAFYKSSLKKTTMSQDYDEIRPIIVSRGQDLQRGSSSADIPHLQPRAWSVLLYHSAGSCGFQMIDCRYIKLVSDKASFMMHQMPDINHFFSREIPENDFHQTKYVDLFKQFPLILYQCRLCAQSTVVSFAEFLIQCHIARVECLQHMKNPLSLSPQKALDLHDVKNELINSAKRHPNL
jgi:hypothetical protein